MNHKRTILLFIFMCGLTLNCYSGTFYVFGFFATSDEDAQVRKSAARDLDSVSFEVKQIATALHLPLSAHYFYNDRFRIDSAYNILTRYKFSKDDIVLVYFATHGVRAISQKSDFPSAIISHHSSDPNQNDILPFESFCNQLKQNNAGLLIGVIDACNLENDGFFSYQGWEKNMFLMFPEINDISTSSRAYKNILLEFKGQILISSTSIDEPSFSQPEKSFFSKNLFGTIKKYIYPVKPVTWDTILEEFKIKTISDVVAYCGESTTYQTPFWHIDATTGNPNTVSTNILYDEFENLLKSGKNELKFHRYKNALSKFKKALQLKSHHTVVKQYIFICEVYLTHYTFSNIDFNVIHKSLINPYYKNYLMGKSPRLQKIQYVIGMSYLKGTNGFKRNFAQGIEWLMRSHGNGFEVAYERVRYFINPNSVKE